MADSISGLTGSGGGNMMRIVGMASGMDIDGMIKKMMLAEQSKVDVVKQQRQTIAWKQEIYQDIIKDVKDLQNTYFNSTSADNLISSKAYSDFKVDSTNSVVATATATAGAVQGNYGIKVGRLAEGATAKSKSLGEGTTINTKLTDLKLGDDSTGITSGNEFQISFNMGSVTKTAKIQIDAGDTFSTLISKIKNTKWEGKDSLVGNDIDVSFSELTHTFTMKTKETGSNTSLQIADATGGDFVTKLELKGKNKDGEDTAIGGLAIGQDAKLHITPPGGDEVDVIKSTNNFTIDGITYNLQGQSELIDSTDPTKRNAENLKGTTLTITQDADKTFDRFAKFIDKYNTLIDKINTKLTEKKNYDYKPLTEAQKKDMKDEEIKAWEEKAKKGVLRNDDNLKNMLSDLRNTFFSKIEGVSESFGKSIGLDTNGTVSKAGQIKFSDDTGELFKQALKDKPDQIMDLFNKTYTLSSDDLTKSKEEQRKITYNNSGIFQRINAILKDNVGSAGVTLNNAILTKYANKQEDYSMLGTGGSNTLPDQIYKKDTLIKTLNSKLKDKETALYTKFSRLETVMNNYNSQSSWLAQQFGG